MRKEGGSGWRRDDEHDQNTLCEMLKEPKSFLKDIIHRGENKKDSFSSETM